ncbi:MAG TPA: alpha/beta hydrolase [Arthrobacter sp.]|uniref:alpha/beta fold hydrolase n=1 Tax=Arthrobacter sp. TaxID=1667 RepID=UPI002F421F2A
MAPLGKSAGDTNVSPTARTHQEVTARIIGTGTLSAHVYSMAGPRTVSARPVFVLLHGIGMSHRYYRRLQVVLAGHGDTHSIDLPGFGAAATPDRQISIADYAAVVADTLDALGAGQVIVVGHSMGSQFATELAVTRPDLVSHVVLIGPVVDSARRNVVRQSLALGLDSLMESPSGNAIVFTDYVRSGLRWYLTELPVMMSYELEARLAKVTQSVLVVRGSRDPVAQRSWCHKLTAIAPHGRFLEIPGQPHIVQHGAAAKTAAGILAFARDWPQSGTLTQGTSAAPTTGFAEPA